MLDAQPGFDEVVVVFAGRVAGLAGMVDGERSFGVGQVHDLTIGWHRDDDFGMAGQRRTHIDGVDVAAEGDGAAIEDLFERFEHTERVLIGQFVDRAVAPAPHIVAQAGAQFLEGGGEGAAEGGIPGFGTVGNHGIGEPGVGMFLEQANDHRFVATQVAVLQVERACADAEKVLQERLFVAHQSAVDDAFELEEEHAVDGGGGAIRRQHVVPGAQRFQGGCLDRRGRFNCEHIRRQFNGGLRVLVGLDGRHVRERELLLAQ